jgi:hypothetical protein
MTQQDMDTAYHLVGRIEQAREQVLGAVRGLSSEQGAFKPAPEEWSAAEVLEHLVLAERAMVMGMWKAAEAAHAGRSVWKGEAIHEGKTIEEVVAQTWEPNQQAPERSRPAWGGPLAYWVVSLECCRPLLEAFAATLHTVSLAEVIFPHVSCGPLNLAQHLELLRFHIDVHHDQIEAVKQTAGFSAA